MNYKYPNSMKVCAVTMYLMKQHRKVDTSLAIMQKGDGYVASANHIPMGEAEGEVKAIYVNVKGGLTPSKKDTVYMIDAFKYEDFDGEVSNVKLHESDMSADQLETFFNDL